MLEKTGDRHCVPIPYYERKVNQYNSLHWRVTTCDTVQMQLEVKSTNSVVHCIVTINGRNHYHHSQLDQFSMQTDLFEHTCCHFSSVKALHTPPTPPPQTNT